MASVRAARREVLRRGGLGLRSFFWFALSTASSSTLDILLAQKRGRKTDRWVVITVWRGTKNRQVRQGLVLSSVSRFW